MNNRIRGLLVATAVLLAAAALISCGNSGSQSGQKSGSSAAAQNAALKDGTYLATYGATDPHGWQEFLQVEVKGGKITTVDFNAINAQKARKTNDQNYNATMKKIAGTNPIEYTAALQKELVSKQTVPVDAVTGATESSKDFNELAGRILSAAQSGDTTPIVLPQNATYTATGKANQHGWMPYVEITFTDNSISGVTVDQVKKENGKITDRQSTDKSFQEQYKKATGKSITDVFSTLESELQKSGDPNTVDAVSSATEISKQFKELASQILSSRASLSPSTITSVLSGST
ncbi:FMN-binding protein [Salinispira pacifica]